MGLKRLAHGHTDSGLAHLSGHMRGSCVVGAAGRAPDSWARGLVCSPLQNSLTLPEKRAATFPKRVTDPETPVLCPGLWTSLITGWLLCSDPPALWDTSGSPSFLTKPSYYPAPRELTPCPLTCNLSECDKWLSPTPPEVGNSSANSTQDIWPLKCSITYFFCP